MTSTGEKKVGSVRGEASVGKGRCKGSVRGSSIVQELKGARFEEVVFRL